MEKPSYYNKAFREVLDGFLDKDMDGSVVLNEADMKSLLYSRLFDKKIFRDAVKRSKKYLHRTNLLHTEYYRPKTKRSKKGNVGRWDIAILYPDAYPEPWIAASDKDANYFDRRPIMIGCELKYKYYRNPEKDWARQTAEEIAGDASVFSGKYPEHGWVVYVDVRENARSMLTKNQQKRARKMFKEAKKKMPHVAFRYIEYNEETGARRIIRA